MLTRQEILLGMVLPLAVSLAIAAVVAWRRWAVAMPLAAGGGFLVAYGCLSVPHLPPDDGNDWLFWMAMPVTLAGIVEAALGRAWGWVGGGLAGVVAGVLLRPLGGVSAGELWAVVIGLFAVGVLIAWLLSVAQDRVGSVWPTAAMCVALGGAGVLVFSSGSRTIGIEGIAAAVAVGPVLLSGGRLRAARAVAVVAVPLLAGVLVAGHYYANVTCTQASVLLLSPALMGLAVRLPLGPRRRWLRGAIGLIAVAIAVSSVTAPAALAAKKAAEVDPYSGYYK